MRLLIAAVALTLLAAPALGASIAPAQVRKLEQARESYLASLPRPISAQDWEARYRAPRWFWEAPPQGPLADYETLVKETAQTAQVGDPGDPYFRRKAIWVRPYAADAIDLRVLEVLDRAQAMGITEIYLETFYHGRVSYLGSQVFPARWPKLNVARVYAREAHHRGMKIYAWLHALRWGEDQIQSGWVEGVTNGYGDTPLAAEGPGSAFVSPSSPQVGERLGALLEEVGQLGYFDGVWLDYMRYPVAAKSRTGHPDPRDFWGYSPATVTALRSKRKDLDTAEFRHFLTDGDAPSEQTRQRWLTAWRGFLSDELRDLIANLRTRLPASVKYGLVFHPSSYMRGHDVRAQDALAWTPLFDELAPMCYAFDPELDPVDASQLRSTIDKELASVDDHLAALPGRRPALVVALAAEPQPGTPRVQPPRRHWPVSAQVAYLKGRRVEGAFHHVEGVALFNYGWLWPASDASRRASDDPWTGAGRGGRPPL
ncbi:MAG: hypothetical protein VKP62_01530 [Candidatus Sericytochromatia bacterium]|nr:hypothetical protein [Candidatus Sericytochromatia bacterium]